MTSYESQLTIATSYHASVDQLQNVVLREVQRELSRYVSNEIEYEQLKERLDTLLVGVFQTSSSFGDNHVARLLEVATWTRFSKAEKSDYLYQLREDVRKNVKAFRSASSEERRKLSMYIGMSFSNAAQRGYAEALQEGGLELSVSGFRVHKVWKANFVNNTPCADCLRLHGTEVGIEDEFDIPSHMKFVDGYAPPLHPRCKCKVLYILSDLSNSGEFSLDSPESTEVTTLTTEDVKKMKPSFFKKLVQGFKKVKEFFKRRRRRGRQY